jgi:hypothetical protein
MDKEGKIKKAAASYIPAQPGYSTVELIRHDDDQGNTEYEPYLRPIISWELAKDTSAHTDDEDIVYVKPITVEGVDWDNPIVYPDGRVELPFMYCYDSVEEWVESEAEYKKRAAEKDRDSSSAPSEPSAAVPDSLG